MTDPKKPRPRRRRPKPESPLPADHPQRIVTDATKAKLPRPTSSPPDAVVEERLRAYEQRVQDAGLLRVTPPPVGVPCVDYTANTSGTFASAYTTRIHVTLAPVPRSPLAKAHAAMLRLSALWDRLATTIARLSA